jgi:DHA2 family metal-tetracycline-proton antiporter-like MFS transporter
VARLLQGVGAAMIPTLSMLIPVRFVAAERRGRALGMVAATLSFSAAIGPIVSGLIVGSFQWRFLFLFCLGAFFAFPFVQKWLPDENLKNSEPVDGLGAGFFVATIVSLMVSVTLWHVGWLAASLFCLILFVIRQKRSAAPFIPIHLLCQRSYRHGLYMGSLNAGVNFGVMILIPLLFSQVYGLNASWIGFLLFPAAICASVLGYFGGKWIDKRGNPFVLTVAVVLLCSGLLLLSTFSGHSVWGISVCLMIFNAGYILMQPALANWVSGTLSPEHTGVGMGVYSFNNFLSTAISGALVTRLVDMVSSVLINPFATSGSSTIYSNLFMGLLLLALINMGLVLRFTVKKSSHE